MRQSFWVFVFAVAGVALAAGAEPVITRSLARLEQSPPVCEGSFEFVVAGDTQSNRQLAYQTDLFRGMIREWNVLKPAFVIEVGDLILGGSADGVPVQWDLFEETIAGCAPPYLPVPGNHDISDALTERIWQDRMGPTRYSFRYGNSRFIVLDSEEVDALDRLSDEQVAWFKGELERSKEANIFVFLHQPYWSDEDDPRNFDATWERRWKYLADVMHGHPVRVVFGGHDH
ncbi:MAG: metallophosphoesterase, partial [Candidatus Hydrogenedentes bacterium]|nr:metallophosphoesterase [Candidatus Hydrogenedentota bacterium]